MSGAPPAAPRRVVTFGETMALLTAPRIQPLRYASHLDVSTGGTESNVAIGLARLGVPVAWCGRVGDDEFGARVLTTLRAEGVDVSGATVDPDASTGLMIKSTPRAGQTSVVYYRRHGAASRLQPSHLDEDAIRGADILHVTGTTAGLSEAARATVHAAIDIARDAGTRVSFDPNHREGVWPAREAAPHLRDLVRRCDLVLAGEDEAPLLVDADGRDATLSALAALGPSGAVLKCGADGAMALVDDDRRMQPAVRTTVVDPVGAGDAFAAGYLAAWLDGAPPSERLRQAVTCAAWVIGVAGDWEGLPTRADLERGIGSDGVSR